MNENSPIDSLLQFISDERKSLSDKDVKILSQAVDIVYHTMLRKVGVFADLTSGEEHTIRVHRNKIAAVKAYRERTGASLIESKNAVESWMQNNLGFKYFN